MRVYHHPRDLLCAHSACGCPEQPSPAFTFMFGRCQNRNLPTGYKGRLRLRSGENTLVQPNGPTATERATAVCRVHKNNLFTRYIKKAKN